MNGLSDESLMEDIFPNSCLAVPEPPPLRHALPMREERERTARRVDAPCLSC